MYNTMSEQAKLHHLSGHIEADEIGIRIDESDYVLPCGQTTRWYK
jgi:hypothetical protein